MKQSVLRQYARLIAAEGGRVQKGQDVIIRASVEQPDFVRLVAEECYRCGARRVTVDWEYQPLSRLHLRSCSLDTLSEVPSWERARLEYQVQQLPVRIYLESDDPDGMRGVDQTKNTKATQARYQVIKPYRDAMENKYQWCIAAVPGEAWAKKVFPGMRTSTAVEKLWEAILFTSRVTEDPIQAWEEHNADLAKRCEYLNSLKIRSLHYTASNGTDLTVGMMDAGRWCGGRDKSLQGIAFNANIPTEECFISPKKGMAEGIVYATKPLSYRGQLIEDFSVRFENGKAVEVHARTGEELLKSMISMDEGAAYLGECALVPQKSPISESGILFYNTLFDENAVCHLALGHGFTNVLRNFERYTLRECYEKGVNESMIHVDFMIGTRDLSVTGLTSDGRRVPVFANGTWAF